MYFQGIIFKTVVSGGGGGGGRGWGCGGVWLLVGNLWMLESWSAAVPAAFSPGDGTRPGPEPALGCTVRRSLGAAVAGRCPRALKVPSCDPTCFLFLLFASRWPRRFASFTRALLLILLFLTSPL